MAITKIDTVYSPELGYHVTIQPHRAPTYVGRVLRIYTRYDVQVMSDVWENMTYAEVVEDDLLTTTAIFLHGTGICAPGERIAEVDATEETLAALAANRAAKLEAERPAREAAAKLAAEKAAAEAERIARYNATLPTKGKLAKVVKGRKVPKGTTGTVIWMGAGNFGTRLGLKDAEGTVHWTAASNCEAVVEKPEELTWVEYLDAERNAEREAKAKLPQKGQRVRIESGEGAGTVGILFWTNGSRCGISPSGRSTRSGYSDAVWASLSNVAAA
jgi:hypothetical protein